jgi:hypothetical protein
MEEVKMVQVNLELQPQLPWFLQKEASVTVNAQTLALPDDFLRATEETPLVWVREDELSPYKALAGGTYAEWAENEDLVGTGLPVAYALHNNAIYLFKEPDQSYDGKLVYYGADTVLDPDVNNTNKWTRYASDILIAEAGFQMAQSVRDTQALQVFSQMRVEAATRLWKADMTQRASGGVPLLEG